MNQDNPMERADIDRISGPVVVEFGAGWCEYCQAAQPIITAALLLHPNVVHIKIEDGKGQRLGRTFAVKLWPTLVFMKDGVELNRLVRPARSQEITDALNMIIS